MGAFYDDTPDGTNAGSAYVFERSDTVWAELAKLTAADGAASDQFGSSVALSANVAMVGAEFGDTALVRDAGSVYGFVRSGSDWTQRVKLTAPDGRALDLFGHSVAVHGKTTVIGADFDDTKAGPYAGSAYVVWR